MNIYVISFSPTGGVQKAADLLAGALGGGAQQIDLCACGTDFSKFSLQTDDLAVIAAPAYGGRMPAVAAERLACIRANGARAVLMAVYGNRAIDDTLLEMQDVAAEAGFACIAGVSAVAEHVFAREYGAGRPDAADAETLRAYAERIRARLAQGGAAPALPGNRPFRSFGGTPIKPLPGDSCVKCGHCAQLCPAGAISADDPADTDAQKCISCMRCTVVCPAGARKADPAPLAAIAEKLRPACTGRREYELYID